MTDLSSIFSNIMEIKKLFMLSGLFIFTDILTGYLKAWKLHKINSSISRDGYIKKITWIVALLLGYIVDELVSANIFLTGTSFVCVATEGISVYENMGELGVNLPFKKHFEKLNKEGE